MLPYATQTPCLLGEASRTSCRFSRMDVAVLASIILSPHCSCPDLHVQRMVPFLAPALLLLCVHLLSALLQAVWEAALAGSSREMLLALRNGGTTEWRNTCGRTPLLCAAAAGHPNIVQVLLERVSTTTDCIPHACTLHFPSHTLQEDWKEADSHTYEQVSGLDHCRIAAATHDKPFPCSRSLANKSEPQTVQACDVELG